MTLRAIDIPGVEYSEKKDLDMEIVLKNTRKKLAKEISRAYMENS